MTKSALFVTLAAAMLPFSDEVLRKCPPRRSERTKWGAGECGGPDPRGMTVALRPRPRGRLPAEAMSRIAWGRASLLA